VGVSEASGASERQVGNPVTFPPLTGYCVSDS
jgi:hypothetical protein